MGAALSDTIYAIVAGFSLSYIITFIKINQLALQIGGGLILIGLGLTIFFTNPAKDVRKFRKKEVNHFHDFLFTFLITLTNPLIVYLYIGALTASGVVFSIDKPYYALFVIIGIYLGCCSWWATLTGVLSIFRHRFNLRLLFWGNKIAGTIIIILVVGALIYSLITGQKL